MKDLRPIAAYYRFSKREQSTPGANEQHRFHLSRAAEVLGEVLLEEHIYVDVMSGTKRNRPEYHRLVEAIRNKVYKIVVVRNDRLGRKIQSNADFTDLLTETGTKLFDMSKGRLIDLSDPGDWRDYHMRSVQSAGESKETSFRVKNSKLFTRQQGRVQGGRAPHGYKIVNGKYEPNDRRDSPNAPATFDEAQRMVKIFLEEGSTIGAARRILTEIGIEISYQAFTRWLLSPAARGNTAYMFERRRDEEDKDKSLRDGKPYCDRIPESTIWGTHKPVIDAETLPLVDAALARIQRVRGKAREGHYALSGLMYCDRCGSHCNISSNRGIQYITCAKYKLGHQCGEFRMNAADTGKRTKRVSTRYSLAEDAAIAAVIQRAEAIATEASEVLAIQADMEEPPEAVTLRRQIQTYEAFCDSALDKVIAQKRAELNSVLSSQSGSVVETERLRDLLTSAAANPRTWQLMSVAERGLLFQELGVKVWVDGDGVRVELKI